MGLRAETANSEPEWQTALHRLRSALPPAQQVHDLRILADSFFETSQDEVEACIQILLDINDVSDSSVSANLVGRWRSLFKELYQVTRRELPKSHSRLAGKDLDSETILTALKSIERSSVPALTSFNDFLKAPTPGRLNNVIGKLGALSNAIGGWKPRMPGG